jgi:hypothetical protein
MNETEKMWWVVGTLTGLRCEEHMWEPDNAISGPYKNADVAVLAMRRIIERDRGMMIAAGVVMVGFIITVAGWLVWMVV